VSWQRWWCESCGSVIELSDEAPVDAWCSSCNEGMPADHDNDEE
jgi:hypothetical protein